MQTLFEPTKKDKPVLSQTFADQLPAMIQAIHSEFQRQRAYSSGIDSPIQSLLRAGHHVLSAVQDLNEMVR